MYKVFFNGSSIQLCSKIKKSSKNNIVPVLNLDDYGFVNQIVSEIEISLEDINYVLVHPDEEKLWSAFRKLFVEIPAAGGLVKNRKGDYLFIHRLGKWDLPKGKIEKDETPEIASVREVEEECGINGVELLKQLDSTWHIYRSPFLKSPENLVLKETKWFLMHYPGDKMPVPQEEENIEEVRWFAQSELNEALDKTYSGLRDFIQKILQPI